MNTPLPLALSLLSLSFGIIFRLKGDHLADRCWYFSTRETMKSACALLADFFMALALTMISIFAPGATLLSTFVAFLFGGVLILQTIAFCATVVFHSEDLKKHFWENKRLFDQFYQC